jgi:hypothetical protein
MTSIFASFLQNGFFESLRLWANGNLTMHAKPPKPSPEYARIRQRKHHGRKKWPAVYQLKSISESEPGEAKSYKRVDDGTPFDDDNVVERVIVPKNVAAERQRKQRVKRKGRRSRRLEHEAAVGACHLPAHSSFPLHVLWAHW